MFEKFGILDVWAVIKRKFVILFVATVGCLVLFSFLNASSIKQSFELTRKESHEQKLAEVCISSYYIQPIIESSQLERIDSSFYKSLPNDLLTILKTDSCKKYVCDNLMLKYSREFLKENVLEDPELNLKTGSEQIFNFEDAIKLYQVKRQENTMILSVAAKSFDSGLSNFILNLLEEFLLKKALPNVKSAQVNKIGSVNRQVDFDNLSPEDEFLLTEEKTEVDKPPITSHNPKTTVITVVKKVLIPTFAIMLLVLIWFIVHAFFNPTFNRKSDFLPYRIPVIGEIK